MFLVELFDSGNDMMNKLRQEALEFITPMLGQDVPFVTVNQVIDALSNGKLGIAINRALVMKILDPDELQAVNKIEGDRIYLNEPDSPQNARSENDKEKEAEHVSDVAKKQAAKNIKT